MKIVLRLSHLYSEDIVVLVYILRQKGNNATDVFQMSYINSVLKRVYQTLVRGTGYLLHYYILQGV